MGDRAARDAELVVTDIALLVSDLKRDEAWRGFLYDDATGAPIKPGIFVRGHPTAGYGFALDVAPLTVDEAVPILTGRAIAAAHALASALPWMVTLSEPRQRALSNMAYNLGVSGLLKFTQFLAFMQAEQFNLAADDLEQTPWYKEVGARGVRIVATIRTGI
jgi:lysozyme